MQDRKTTERRVQIQGRRYLLKIHHHEQHVFVNAYLLPRTGFWMPETFYKADDEVQAVEKAREVLSKT